MARGRGKKGGKAKNIQNVQPPADKKIGKKSAKKKKKAPWVAGASTSAQVPVQGPFQAPVQAPTPAPAIYASAQDTIANGSKIATKEKLNERVDGNGLPGFIFMCSGQTKPECYQHRVFGLPYGKMNVVKNIKQGAKLFLYDFDLRLLYGIYEATSDGGHSLAPSAFGGRFPAQVGFKIAKDCLPLPMRDFRNAILEKYEGSSKFKPELSSQQVQKLTALFRPIDLQHHAAPVAQVAPPPHANQPQVVDDQFRPVRRATLEDPYAAMPHHPRAPPFSPVQDPYRAISHHARVTLQGPPEDPYASMSHHPRAAQVLDSRYVRPVSLQSYSDPYQAYVPEDPALPLQDPYARYRGPEMVQQDHHIAEHYRLLLERERGMVPQLEHRLEDYYSNQNLAATYATSHTLPPSYPSHPSYSTQQPYAPQPSYGHSAVPHASVELQSYQQAVPYYATTVGYEDPTHAYTDPHQRLVSGRVNPAGTSVPVSSLYAFAGPTPTYR
ncbi:hypothetical protein GIB67_004076 [Kingdonia uniflora]|uniref:DCD domain-containing protein n=1 Tax=Kingdonia uniflora TaxID=39325 RepID=A0A7J7NRU1_9MAGN|nr:hypothetical protein GIB67_004076 [Kingdonia uniflora]